VRIALTHAFCQPEVRRGAERFVPGLAASLARRGHDVTHISSAWDSGTETVAGVRTIRMKRFFRDQFRHEADFGRRLLPRLVLNRYDAVHSMGRHDASASVTAARVHRRRRTMITDLGLPNPRSWAHYGSREVAAAQRAVDGLDVYSCMSATAVEYLAENYGRHDGVVVPGGVDLASFEPSAEREAAPTILVSGAIAERRKGVPVLLEALPLIAESEPQVAVWLSGPGDPKEMLANAPAEARERTKVLGIGESDHQHERYGRAWITCLPSTHDSFGMALLESLACGTPIVATTHSAPKELVTPGLTGELCEPDDPRGLAEACLQAFALTRRTSTASACRESATPYDWDAGLAPLCEALYAGEEPPIVFPPRRPAETMNDENIAQI
jgi:glycosyltransferase involved in cell wall biosynthesis